MKEGEQMKIYRVEECFAGNTWIHGFYMDANAAEAECIRLLRESYAEDVLLNEGETNEDCGRWASFHVVPCDLVM